MTDQTPPPEIWLDARVARGIPTEPDEAGTPLIRYFSADRVKELVDLSRGGPEFFVQVVVDQGDNLVALSNYGRIFAHDPNGIWTPVEIPDLGADHA